MVYGEKRRECVCVCVKSVPLFTPLVVFINEDRGERAESQRPYRRAPSLGFALLRSFGTVVQPGRGLGLRPNQ